VNDLEIFPVFQHHKISKPQTNTSQYCDKLQQKQISTNLNYCPKKKKFSTACGTLEVKVESEKMNNVGVAWVPALLLLVGHLACLPSAHGQPFCHQIDFELQAPYSFTSIAIESQTDSLFVGDYNGAVYRYPNIVSLLNATTTPDVSFTGGLGGVIGIYVDARGRLWAADSLNHRVVYWDNATTAVSNRTSIDGYFGSNTGNHAWSMNFPDGVFVDSSHNTLWVADTVNNRVLRFDDVYSKPPGAAADGVLGQPGFNTSNSVSDASGMNWPYSVAVDSAGGVYVADYGNNRVVRDVVPFVFPPPPSLFCWVCLSCYPQDIKKKTLTSPHSFILHPQL